MRKELKCVVLTDELLDHLAEQFDFYSVRDLLGITFGQFVENPQYYLDRACKLADVVLETRRAWEREHAQLMKRLWSYCDMDGTRVASQTSVN